MNSRSFILAASCVCLSACNMAPGTYRDGEPYQAAEVKGEPKAVAECVQQALAAAGWPGVQLGRDPKTGLYVVTNGDTWGGILQAIAFDPAGRGRTTVSTRGIAYAFGPIPPWSQQVMDAAKGCENVK
jgi:hypothetical protein